MDISAPVHIHTNRKIKMKTAVVLLIIAIVIALMALFLADRTDLKILLAICTAVMFFTSVIFFIKASSKTPWLTLTNDGVILYRTKLPPLDWSDVAYTEQQVVNNQPVLAIYINDVELYAQKIPSVKLREQFIALKKKNNNSRLLHIPLNEIDYDIEELQNIFEAFIIKHTKDNPSVIM